VFRYIEFNVGATRVILRRAVLVSEWVEWLTFIETTAERDKLEAGTRAVARLDDVMTDYDLDDITSILSKLEGGAFELGRIIITASSYPKEMKVRKWLDIVNLALDYDPDFVDPDNDRSPCQCAKCRKLQEERDETCHFFGFPKMTPVIADIDYELAATLWERPLMLYQLADMKRRARALGQSAEVQANAKKRLRKEGNQTAWKEFNLPPSPRDRR